MSTLIMPPLSADPARLRRSGLRWLKPSGATLAAREPLAMCYLRLSAASGATVPLPEEQNDLQLVLAPAAGCQVQQREGLSDGGYRDMVEGGEWRSGEAVAEASGLEGTAALVPLVLAGRRGFESGEGRGSLLAGWHDKVRASWEGAGGRFGHVLALGTCEQNAVFRGDDMAFLSWFARAPGPVQISAVSDERCVHSSAVLLQHVRRTPVEALAIAEAVQAWVGARMAALTLDSFPGFRPGAGGTVSCGRWPEAQEIAFAMNLLAEAVGSSPILERTETLTARGITTVGAPDVIAITLGSEVAPHFRHKRTGWILALHGFRFGPYIGPAITDWLRADFEPVHRTVLDVQRDLAALADEVRERTGGTLMVQNLIASTAADRVANYSWLGDAAADSVSVLGNEANLMLGELTRSHGIVMIDSDALAAALGVNQVPDRFHGSSQLVAAQRGEVHRALRGLEVPGF